MGVFDRILRRSKATEEASTAEAQAAAQTAEPVAEEAAEAERPAEGTVEATATEAVDIPKQQSAEEAADNEAGEGART